MAKKYIRKVSTGPDILGGLQTSRYEKGEFAFGVIPAGEYSIGDVISFAGIPALRIIEGTIMIHSATPVVLEINPGTDLSAAVEIDTATASKISYVLHYIRGTGLVGAGASQGQILDLSVQAAAVVVTPVVEAVHASPDAGDYVGVQDVVLSTATSGASIRYTLDGSTPSATVGTAYTVPIELTADDTIKAIAYKTGSTSSAVATFVYTIA